MKEKQKNRSKVFWAVVFSRVAGGKTQYNSFLRKKEIFLRNYKKVRNNWGKLGERNEKLE
ncbi:MAG: hypothetical protein SOZ02_09265 [Hallerella porci]|uniref:hypothetical protein n=1 Tax=Hallerella TaxID=2815788 RepID=UPI000D07A44B|nr:MULTISPECIES: hypothetical protein [Hallerella]MCI5600219.1 hypothetical protein [Hallerella sp.]MDY3922334.1 hypothetical protein [Hallerella porci]